MLKEVDKLEQEVQDYYGKELQSSEDLKTNACCTVADMPQSIKGSLKNIHEEVLSRYYGCGLTIPDNIDGLRVLDLGCGSGRDCYLLSQLVGEQGFVLGVDMTDEQLEIANRYVDWHREKFGFRQSNIGFVKGNIQDLQGAGVASGDFDVIVSNCVVNLAADKKAVLSEAYRALKTGGEFYFSDVYCNRRIPSKLMNDRELYGECLSGALYWNDFYTLAKQVGFTDPRIVESRPLTIENESVRKKTAGYGFYSVTHRLFKLPDLESAGEDYGQAVKYLGGVHEQPHRFRLDDQHIFEKGRVIPVCGNTWKMLADTRYNPYFEFYGNFDQHFGIFPGDGVELPFRDDNNENTDQAIDSGCC